MSYTLLLKTEAGIPLLDYHLRRLGLQAPGPAREEFLAQARRAGEGCWAVRGGGGAWTWEARASSRLREGLPADFAVSPAAAGQGSFPKPASPSFYDALRREGRVSLLTSADGAEIYEACSAAVLAWEGGRLVCPPADRPRVWSTAETALREHLGAADAPIPASSRSLILVNALKGCCALGQGLSEGFPEAWRRRIDDLFVRLNVRP